VRPLERRFSPLGGDFVAVDFVGVVICFGIGKVIILNLF